MSTTRITRASTPRSASRRWSRATPVARLGQRAQQLQALRLRQRLAAGHAHVARAELAHALEDRIELPPLAAVKRIGGIAILATQRTAGQAYEYGRYADAIGFTLQRVEDLRELEPDAQRRVTRLSHPESGAWRGP
jgi:hypothetical protein